MLCYVLFKCACMYLKFDGIFLGPTLYVMSRLSRCKEIIQFFHFIGAKVEMSLNLLRG
jgi:hypothetical protein